MKNRLAAFFMHEITKTGDKKCRQMGKEICRHLQVVLYSIPLFFIFEFKILPGIGNKNQKIQTDKNAEKQGKNVFLLH